MEVQNDDQVGLINNNESQRLNNSVLVPYAVSKLLPFGWIFLSTALFTNYSTFIYFIVLIMVISDLWLCRRTYSYKLVGLTWSLEMPDRNNHSTLEDIVSYEIEPDPFVPSPIDSNVFWLLLTGTTAFYILFSIYYLFNLKIGAFFFLIVIDALEMCNLSLYLRCLSVSKKESEESFRSVMINAVHSEFQDAVPVVEDDGNIEVPVVEATPVENRTDKNENEDDDNKSDLNTTEKEEEENEVEPLNEIPFSDEEESES